MKIFRACCIDTGSALNLVVPIRLANFESLIPPVQIWIAIRSSVAIQLL